MERVLITGANGLLGQKLVIHFSKWFTVLATSRQNDCFLPIKHFDYKPLEITDKGGIHTVLTDLNPDLIINAAAYTDVDGCEENKAEAKQVNVDAVQTLADWCAGNGRKLIQYSTDYIFDGREGPYSEEATPNPLCYYGQTKLESEKLIQNSGCQHLVIRSNVIFGVGEKVKNNFFLWTLEQFKAGKPFKVVDDQSNNPTLADNLALATLEAVEKNLSGTINIAGSEYLSRYEFATKLAEVFKLNKNLLSPTKTASLNQKAVRPLKGGLKLDLAKSLIHIPFLDVSTALDFIRTYYDIS